MVLSLVDELDGADTMYKRHHSTGNMLLATASLSVGSAPHGRGVVGGEGGSQGATPVRSRPLRPKSTGNLSAEGMRARRASSFGVNVIVDVHDIIHNYTTM